MSVQILRIADEYTNNPGGIADTYLSNGDPVNLQLINNDDDDLPPNTISVKKGILIITMNAVLETYNVNTILGIKFEATVDNDSIFDPHTSTLLSESEGVGAAPDMHNLSTTKIIKINNDTKITFTLTMIGTAFTFNSSTSDGTPLTAPDGDEDGAGPGTEGAARQPFIEINCLNL